ncbi:MAG: DUF1778 domain-containing protein [Armatimonadetes bacterium]|nr:DUF1778 domain-containing protein [Armatimonadota bacterium]
MEQHVSKAEDRLSIRTNLDQKLILRRAADKRHMNVSQFVLQASLTEAERILQDETKLVLSSEDYAWLCKLMDAPPRDLPKLREALSKKPVWDE